MKERLDPEEVQGSRLTGRRVGGRGDSAPDRRFLPMRAAGAGDFRVDTFFPFVAIFLVDFAIAISAAAPACCRSLPRLGNANTGSAQCSAPCQLGALHPSLRRTETPRSLRPDGGASIVVKGVDWWTERSDGAGRYIVDVNEEHYPSGDGQLENYTARV